MRNDAHTPQSGNQVAAWVSLITRAVALLFSIYSPSVRQSLQSSRPMQFSEAIAA
jgi:hypothetical protein